MDQFKKIFRIYGLTFAFSIALCSFSNILMAGKTDIDADGDGKPTLATRPVNPNNLTPVRAGDNLFEDYLASFGVILGVNNFMIAYDEPTRVYNEGNGNGAANVAKRQLTLTELPPEILTQILYSSVFTTFEDGPPIHFAALRSLFLANRQLQKFILTDTVLSRKIIEFTTNFMPSVMYLIEQNFITLEGDHRALEVMARRYRDDKLVEDHENYDPELAQEYDSLYDPILTALKELPTWMKLTGLPDYIVEDPSVLFCGFQRGTRLTDDFQTTFPDDTSPQDLVNYAAESIRGFQKNAECFGAHFSALPRCLSKERWYEMCSINKYIVANEMRGSFIGNGYGKVKAKDCFPSILYANAISVMEGSDTSTIGFNPDRLQECSRASLFLSKEDLKAYANVVRPKLREHFTTLPHLHLKLMQSFRGIPIDEIESRISVIKSDVLRPLRVDRLPESFRNTSDNLKTANIIAYSGFSADEIQQRIQCLRNHSPQDHTFPQPENALHVLLYADPEIDPMTWNESQRECIESFVCPLIEQSPYAPSNPRNIFSIQRSFLALNPEEAQARFNAIQNSGMGTWFFSELAPIPIEKPDYTPLVQDEEMWWLSRNAYENAPLFHVHCKEDLKTRGDHINRFLRDSFDVENVEADFIGNVIRNLVEHSEETLQAHIFPFLREFNSFIDVIKPSSWLKLCSSAQIAFFHQQRLIAKDLPEKARKNFDFVLLTTL